MPIIKIQDLDDPRLTIYRDLRNTNLVRQSGEFIAEGWRVVQRLLNSQFEVRSVLLSEKREDSYASSIPADVDVYVVPEKEASRLVGFPFHAGVLACGVRLATPSLDSIIQRNNRRSRVVLCCPKVTAPDNLGSLIRLGASFGIQGILLGPGSVDPYIRRVIRVSMGTCFDFPVRVSPELFNELRELQLRNQAVIIAAEKTNSSSYLDRSLCTPSRNEAGSDSHEMTQDDCPIFVLLGNEADGLAQEWIDLADKTFHIPIQDEVDSLNVTHAAAIFLYELTR